MDHPRQRHHPSIAHSCSSSTDDTRHQGCVEYTYTCTRTTYWIIWVSSPGPIVDLKQCRSAVDAFFSISADYLHSSNSANSNTEDTNTSHILLQERQDKLDREGVMLWNRSSSLRHLLSDRSFDIEADNRSNYNKIYSPSHLIAKSTWNTTLSFCLLSIGSSLNAFLLSSVRFTAVRLIHAGNPEMLAIDTSGHKSNQHRSRNIISPYLAKDAIRLLDLYSKSLQELTSKTESRHILVLLPLMLIRWSIYSYRL